MKIMIVDDSSAMRMMVKRMLRMIGMDTSDIVEACDGAEALGMITADRPDLVLCDWNMPNMTGIELLEKLKEEQINPPFGFVTTEASPEMKDRATSAGARFLISKPFTEETFTDALSAYM